MYRHYDILGQELEEGDDVLVNNKRYQKLELAVVSGFTEVNVRIKCNTFHIPNLITPTALVKIKRIKDAEPDLFV